jgi:predicted anti-sigma-YlaC factor YlaD
VRARLLPAGVGPAPPDHDPEVEAHLAGCAACFAALEAADPVVRLLTAARPADAAAPAAIGAAILGRWRPRRAHWRARLAGVAIAAVLAVALAIEALVGAEPARLTLLIGTAGSSWIAPIAGAVAALGAIRAAAFDVPGLLAGLSLVTVAICGLWMRFVLALPTWAHPTKPTGFAGTPGSAT